MELCAKFPPVIWVTTPWSLILPQTSDCIFQLKWNITTEIALYIQNSPKKTWSQAETWHVPPLPGPSQGKRKPRFALSGIKRELRANRTPFRSINTVTWIVNAWMWCTKKSAVPNGIGNKATLPPTATKSPPPQVKLVLVIAPGAVALGAKAWVFCIHWAKTGCNWIAVSENISWGRPKALMVSLWIYKPKLWKPRNIHAQLRCDIIASRCLRTRSNRSLYRVVGS